MHRMLSALVVFLMHTTASCMRTHDKGSSWHVSIPSIKLIPMRKGKSWASACLHVDASLGKLSDTLLMGCGHVTWQALKYLAHGHQLNVRPLILCPLQVRMVAWRCPVCRGICNCSSPSCQRLRSGLDMTGPLHFEARNYGYDSVRS